MAYNLPPLPQDLPAEVRLPEENSAQVEQQYHVAWEQGNNGQGQKTSQPW